MRSFILQLMCILACSIAWAEPPTYDLTAEQFGTLPPAAILIRAKEFALQNRTLPAASRAGLDWHSASTALGNVEEQKAARMFLLLEHPKTTAGVAMYRSFTDDAQLAVALLEEFNREDRSLDTPFLTRYVLAAFLAPESQAAAARQNIDFLLSYVYALQSVGYPAEHELVRAAQHLIRQRDASGESSRILELLLSKNALPAERFVSLQEFKSRAVARAIQRGYFLRLQIQDRVRAPEIRLHVDNLIAGQKWNEALTWLDKLPEDARDAQTRFWQGWSLASVGQTDEAIAALETLLKTDADTPWTPPTKELLAAIRGEQERLESVVPYLQAGIAAWRQHPPEVIEARVIALGEDGQELAQGYLGLDTTRSHVELMVLREGNAVAAYQTTQGRTKTLVAGRPFIASFARGGLIPSPWIHFDESADGKYNFRFGANVRDGMNGDLADLLKSLVASPVLADGASLFRWLKHGRHYGSFLEAALPQDRRLVWLTPAADKPACERFILNLGADGQLESIHAKSFRIEEIHFGKADEVALHPPRWPDLPERSQEEFQAGEFFSLAGAGMEAISEALRLGKRTDKTDVKQR